LILLVPIVSLTDIERQCGGLRDQALWDCVAKMLGDGLESK
jgi:hypothetical protein